MHLKSWSFGGPLGCLQELLEQIDSLPVFIPLVFIQMVYALQIFDQMILTQLAFSQLVSAQLTFLVSQRLYDWF